MKNQIELKSVKFSEWNSEETNCFQAMVYFNGKRAGMASNEGRGGCTWVRPTDNIEDYKALVAHCEALVKSNSEEYYETFSIIDILFEAWLESHYAKKDKARMEREFNKGICYTKDESKGTYAVMTFKKGTTKVTISELLKSANGRGVLIRSYEKLVSDGNKILNTNLNFVS
jgi:hypothetical protein